MTDRKWWHSATVYQIYPRSFCDSNGDGIGDLRGITGKLEYIRNLGIDIIWISPMFCSPMDDNGYDISDYRNVDPMFGTLDDMKELLARAKSLGLKIILDLVANHTSDEHAWFVESRDNPQSEKRAFYVWRKGSDGGAPSEIGSVFGGSAWQYDEKSGEYYLHMFSRKQPDLDWHNEKVRDEIFSMMEFWAELGVSGFRMDVIDMIGKQIDQLDFGNNEYTHRYLHEMYERVLGPHDMFTVGETGGANIDRAKLFSDPEREELSCVFQFETIAIDEVPGKSKWALAPFSLDRFKEIVNRWQIQLPGEGCQGLFWCNHDQPRALSRWGTEGEHRVRCAKMMCNLLHFLCGIPFVYQGEEFGMLNGVFDSIEDYNDIEIINYYNSQLEARADMEQVMHSIRTKGRDNARTPMQWDATENAGFTTGTPWLRINPRYREINALAAVNDPDSIYYHYKAVIEYRKQSLTVQYGSFQLLDSDSEVFAYIRENEGERLLIVCNFFGNTPVFSLDESIGECIISNYPDFPTSLSDITLRPYESFAVILN